MTNPTNYKEFIFNEKIDKDSLTALYEDDFPYIEEIFSITLTQLQPDVAKLPAAFQSKDIAGLRKLVHKIKPSFGFVGMDATQALCKSFEDECSEISSQSGIEDKFNRLYQEVSDAVKIVEEELTKLKEFNKS